MKLLLLVTLVALAMTGVMTYEEEMAAARAQYEERDEGTEDKDGEGDKKDEDVKEKEREEECKLDPATEFCCGNQTFKNDDKGDQECCSYAAKLYDPQESICCYLEGSEIIKKADEQDNACCRSFLAEGTAVSYNDETHACCGEVLTEINKEMPPNDCCGKVPFNRDLQACCDKETGKVLDKADKDKRSKFCCGDRTFRSDSQCCRKVDGVDKVLEKVDKKCPVEKPVDP